MKSQILVVIDIQSEYVAEGRPFQIRSIQPSLSNAHRVLKHARDVGWKIVHIRHIQQGSIFSPDGAFSGFIPGFEPQKGEQEIIKGDFSCYSAPEFSAQMAEHRKNDDEIIVIGYGSTMCCLSTIVDGYHRGNRLTFIKDASNAKSSSMHSEESLHEHATDILSIYSRVTTTNELLNAGKIQ